MNFLVRNHLIMRDKINLLCTGDQPDDYNTKQTKYDRLLNCTSTPCWSNPVSQILDDECQHGLLESRTGNSLTTQKNEKIDALIFAVVDEIVYFFF